MKSKKIVPFLGYAILVVLIFGTGLFPSSEGLLFGDDIHRQYYFYRQFLRESLSNGVIPWWNPYIFSGVPFIANPVVNFWYPLNWLFLFFPLNLAYSWHIAFHIGFAM
ncbi:MAG: hypothetical protein Q7S76_02395, partial [bacterium]|nr:hypothetical protein [bacterium]